MILIVGEWRRGLGEEGELEFQAVHYFGEEEGREAGTAEVVHESMVDWRWLYKNQDNIPALSIYFNQVGI